MGGIKEMWNKLPKWAKIGLPVAVAAIAVYVFVKEKGSSSGTTTESVASGSPDSASGASTSPATDTSTAATGTSTPAVDPSQPATPSGSIDPGPLTPINPPYINPPHPAPEPPSKYTTPNANWTALAAHWEDQAKKDSKSKGVALPKGFVTVTANMSEADAMAAYETDKNDAYAIEHKTPPHVATSNVASKAASVPGKTHTASAIHITPAGPKAALKESPKAASKPAVHPLAKAAVKTPAKAKK